MMILKAVEEYLGQRWRVSELSVDNAGGSVQ